MFLRRRSPQVSIRLMKEGNQFYIEEIYPVEVVSDNLDAGIRLLGLKSLNSKRTHFFKVRSLDKYKNINKKMVRGIILRKD